MSAPVDTDAPPVGEEIHLPGQTAIPLINAIGVTLIVVGSTIGAPMLILGVILFVGSTARWILDARREIAELPDEHRH